MWEIAVIFGLIAVITLFTILSFILGKEHLFLKVFFLLLSFLFVGVGLYMIKEIAEDNYSTSISGLLATTYAGYIYVFMFVFFYFIIKIIYAIVQEIKYEKNKTGFEEDSDI